MTATQTAAADEAVARIPTWSVRVASNEPVTAGLRAVRATGLDGFEPAGPDVFFFALVSADAAIAPGDAMAVYLDRRPDGPVQGAYYTLRHWEPETATATFWVVDHGHEAGVGAWLARSRPGEGLALWGPRLGFDPPDDADRLLLVADETGYAVVARVVEGRRAGCRVDAVLERGDVEPPPMPEHPDVTYRWVRRAGAPGTGDELVDAVAGVDLTSGRWAAFGAAESRQVTRVRKLLRHDRRLATTQVSMVGYWRRAPEDGG